MKNSTLEHHGILGMKWGVRRYQNSDGSLTSAGRKRRGISSNTSKATQKQKKKTEHEAESVEKKKVRVLKSRSAKELYDNADLFTTRELQDAYNRLALERSISSLTPKEVSKGESFVNNAIKWTNKASDLINAGTKAYNSVNAVAKLFNDTPEPQTSYSKKSLGKMTDKELDAAVNRMSKEKSFKSLLKELDDTPKSEPTTNYSKKSLSEMSDKELKDAITRMASEKSYANLKKDLDSISNPKHTATKNLIGDLSDLTDEQVKDINDRLDLEKKVIDKLANR